MVPAPPVPEIDPDLCQPCSIVVAMIPEVKAGLALRAFNCLVSSVQLGRYEGALEVSGEEVQGATGVISECGQTVITPKGARLLRRLFEAGLIQQKRASSLRDLSALDAYIASEPDLLRRTAERRAPQTA